MSPTTAPFCQRERSALCDLLDRLGPDAPTLCAGWRSADLAAHLVARDRRPDAMIGMTLKDGPLAAWSTRAQHHVRDSTAWAVLLQRLRSGPALLLKPLEAALSTVEFFVHHEDLRRAQEGWEPRAVLPEDEDLLWRHLKGISLFRHPPAPAVTHAQAPGRPLLKLPRTGRPRTGLTGTGPSGSLPADGGGAVVRGPVPELVLWLNGRTSVARVEVTAPRS